MHTPTSLGADMLVQHSFSRRIDIELAEKHSKGTHRMS